MDSIRTYTLERWGRAQWLDYYRGLVDVLEKIEASPMSGRSRDLSAPLIAATMAGSPWRFVVQTSPVRISEIPDSDYAKSRTAVSVIPGQLGHG
jgi:toxin ParE1/3/4